MLPQVKPSADGFLTSRIKAGYCAAGVNINDPFDNSLSHCGAARHRRVPDSDTQVLLGAYRPAEKRERPARK